MKFKEFFNNLLSEMVERMSVPNGNIIVAHRENVWRLGKDRTQNEPVVEDIIAKTGLPDQFEDEDDLKQFIRWERPDIFYGKIIDGVLYKEFADILYYGKNSPLIAKIIKMYNLKSYMDKDYQGDQHMIPKHEVKDEYPSIVFHGTTARNMSSILKIGLVPNIKGNWKFKFDDKLFVTNKPFYAAGHAMNASNKSESSPVVLELKVPDKNKLTLDFDIARRYEGSTSAKSEKEGYTSVFNDLGNSEEFISKQVKKHSPKTDFTKATGIYGYRGRIPASHILSMYYVDNYKPTWSLSINHMTKVTDPSKFKQIMDSINDVGYYDPDWRNVDNEL